MHIIIKSPQQIAYICEAGKYLTEMLILLRDASKPGTVLLDLEQLASNFLKQRGIT